MPGHITVVEEYVTDRGRTRQRRIQVDRSAFADRFREPASADRDLWTSVRAEMERVVGEQGFAMWLAPIVLRAVEPASGALLLVGHPATRAWVTKRFRRLFDQITAATGREVRLVDKHERELLDALFPEAPDAATAGDVVALPTLPDRQTDHKEAI